MKKVLILSIAIVFLMGFAPCVNAIIIDFEPPDFLPPPFSVSDTDIGVGYQEAGSGYDNMVDYTGSQYFAFNPREASPSNLFSTVDFDLTSFLVAGAWGDQTLSIEGLNDGSVIYSSALAVTPAVQLFEPNWFSIDQLRITIDPSGYVHGDFDGMGQHWVVDNMVIDENVAPVPEPSTIVLMGLGLIGLAGLGRKKMKR